MVAVHTPEVYSRMRAGETQNGQTVNGLTQLLDLAGFQAVARLMAPEAAALAGHHRAALHTLEAHVALAFQAKVLRAGVADQKEDVIPEKKAEDLEGGVAPARGRLRGEETNTGGHTEHEGN